MKRYHLGLLAAILVVAMVIVAQRNPILRNSYLPFLHPSNNTHYENIEAVSHVVTYPCPSGPGTSKLTICPGDAIPEAVALSFPPCTDYKLAADANNSVLSLKGKTTGYKQGDIISLTITLYDGYGRMKTTGGDQLRARLVADGRKSFVTGIVDDHDNGSYTARFEALFAGAVTLDVMLSYTRETITSLYRIRTEMPATRSIFFKFVKGNRTEETRCHTFRGRLLTNYHNICNLTKANSGMPWYCGKPVNLSCNDWLMSRTGTPYLRIPFNAAETSLIGRFMRSIPNTINLTVQRTNPNPLSNRASLVPCSKYNRTDLWYKREPTGYIQNGRWILRYCNASTMGFERCLNKRRLIIFGDSTSRQWFTDIVRRFECKIVSEPWTTQKWHRRSKCRNQARNFMVEWIPHSQPFFLGPSGDVAKFTTVSMSRVMDEEIDDNDHVIVVVHLFIHVLAFRHDVFQTKIRRVRQSVEQLLLRNKHAHVLIKAPHTFRKPTIETARQADYAGYLFRNILFREFYGLHDRVIYLDNKDMTNANQNAGNHPADNVVSAMVDQVVSYVC